MMMKTVGIMGYENSPNTHKTGKKLNTNGKKQYSQMLII
jgi:hypothetical protein